MKRHILSAAQTLPTDWETVESLVSRCRAAARLSMRGNGYSPEDRAECAAHLSTVVLTDAAPIMEAARCRRCNGPARHTCELDSGVPGITATVPMCHKHRTGISRPILTGADCLPAVPFGRLSGMAANYRRATDRRLERDRIEAAETAAREAFIPRAMEDPSPYVTTPDKARKAAMEALSALGLARLGKCYPAAYAHARLSGAAALGETVPMDRIALELRYSGETPDKAAMVAIRRALDKIPSYRAGMGMAAHLEAAQLLDTGGLALKPSRSRNLTADLETDWRCKLETEGEITRRTDKAERRDGRRTYPLPQWARDLQLSSPASAQRLERAADIRRERKRASDARELAPLAFERGDVVTVR